MSETNNFRSGYIYRDAAYGLIDVVVQLVADGQAIVQDPLVGFIRLTSDDTTAANRTFTIASGSAMGQRLYLVLESGSSTTCQLASSGNVQLANAAAWEPVQWQTLSLIWNGTYWIELARTVTITP